MLLRGRRHAGRRLVVVALSLFTYLSSAAPVAATTVYCISDDGHAEFELMRAGERGCASCCHDEKAGAAHDDGAADPVECTDIALSSDQAIRATASADRDSLAFTPSVVAAQDPRLRLDVPAFESTHAALAPPRSSPAVLLRHTVLLI